MSIGEGVEEPQRVVGPVGAQLHHHRRAVRRGSVRQSPQDGVVGHFLLGLVDAAQTADDLRRQHAVVPAFGDEYAVVHHLQSRTVAFDHVAGALHPGQEIGIGAGHRGGNTSGQPVGDDRPVRLPIGGTVGEIDDRHER